ncbi:MAG: chemotaxis response regulator protein-glutamate methylesterase [Spirochaetales bacterium]|nr:chemotaxis response regulator protein-glutamate methylesterase [Spirochaetales bacterium]
MSIKKINLLIVDDSALVRQSFLTIFEQEQIFEIDTAADPIFAMKKMERQRPDVIILDIEMPKMDGLTFLQKIMKNDPIPVVICSSLTYQGSEKALEALEYGAVEVIEKPKLGTRQFLEEAKMRIVDAVRAAAKVKKVKTTTPSLAFKVAPKLTADAILSLPKGISVGKTEKIIVVGASTGGTEALKYFLETLPDNMPPILIVQHMPKHFTKAFADRLNKSCKLEIAEAQGGEVLKRGLVYVAPGDSHMLLNRQGSNYVVEVKEGPLVCRHRPSVDVLFRSAARYAGKNAIGIIMTGMGDDGARGMAEMKETGATTIAQNEATCVVYGMPKEAVKRNAVDFILPLEEIGKKLVSLSV